MAFAYGIARRRGYQRAHPHFSATRPAGDATLARSPRS